MSQYSDPFEKITTFKTRDGREFTITYTYIDRLESEPFQRPDKGAQTTYRLLIKRELSGEITDTEALELIAWINGGYVGRRPSFIE